MFLANTSVARTVVNRTKATQIPARELRHSPHHAKPAAGPVNASESQSMCPQAQIVAGAKKINGMAATTCQGNGSRAAGLP